MALWREVALLAEELAGESGRLKKRAAIAAAIGRVAAGSSDDAGLLAMYLSGEAFSECDGRKLNAGGALLSRAALKVSGATDAALTAAYRVHGDLGASAGAVWPADASGGVVTLAELREAFAAMAGARTTAIRAGIVEGLLARCDALEAKYLLKLMLADMRIGVKQALIEEAIAVAATEAGVGADAAAVRHAVMLEADLGHAVVRAFAGTLAEARMTLFHPLGFMLASPVDTPEEAVARFTAKPVAEKKPKAKKRTGRPEDVAADVGFAADVEAESGGDGRENADLSTASAKGADSGRDDKFVGMQSGADSGQGYDIAVDAGILAFLEDKYDGMRAQVHCGDAAQSGRVAIYSRNREDITVSFPEIAEAFAGVTEPLILDGEILGWDFATVRAVPFAVMGQRIGRKVVSDELRRQIPVVFMGFDLLFAEGNLLLPLSLSERRLRLEAVADRWREAARAGFAKAEPQGRLFGAAALLGDGAATDPALSRSARKDGPPEAGDGTLIEAMPVRWLLSASQRVADAAAIDAAYRDARARKNEGVMIKAAGSAYLPGRRGLAWVKLKRELGTLDVVITGAEYGSGKRAQLLSDYTFAVRSAEGELLNVGKAYSGVTDAEILQLTEWLKEHTLEDFGHFRTVEPQIVLEVAFNNVMRSDRHASGFALRFPRIVRLRDDKPLAEIDTVERVEEIYQSQPDRPEE